MIRVSVIICLFISFQYYCACQSPNNQKVNKKILVKKKDFHEFLNERGQVGSNYKRIIVIPGAGCLSCITQAETYFNQNYLNSEILFIFTIIDDEKIFKQAIPIATTLKNVIVDSNNELYYMGFYSQYPHEFVISDDEYISVLLFNSSENDRVN